MKTKSHSQETKSKENHNYYITHKEQIRARKRRNIDYIKNRARMNAFRKVMIKENDKCSVCQSKDNLSRHHKNYLNQLEVIIICRKCHNRLHKSKNGVLKNE